MNTPARPTLIDLFCGRGGWTKPALARGWNCIGYDVTDHGYPGQLRLRSLPVPLAELAAERPALIVASPPCEAYARWHLPWLRNTRTTPPDETLLRWATSLIGRFPMVVIECSRFAARHVPGSRWLEPYALWGDLPALLPPRLRPKNHAEARWLAARDAIARTPEERQERAAARAEIDPALADWIVTVADIRRARALHPAASTGARTGAEGP